MTNDPNCCNRNYVRTDPTLPTALHVSVLQVDGRLRREFRKRPRLPGGHDRLLVHADIERSGARRRCRFARDVLRQGARMLLRVLGSQATAVQKSAPKG